ncbi:Uu.00g023490.m01.CDS01 [Anthostomella pinea]|uniref:Uu.00g023490.m01.CDS01 n=1 Tax=Anthostomella pinea TaxID=933095 RepID=A0AAI8W0K7_9PEZI|nr:Uu.00g023490.m01.CDS01 [Anthostomella pinea]
MMMMKSLLLQAMAVLATQPFLARAQEDEGGITDSPEDYNNVCLGRADKYMCNLDYTTIIECRNQETVLIFDCAPSGLVCSMLVDTHHPPYCVAAPA